MGGAACRTPQPPRRAPPRPQSGRCQRRAQMPFVGVARDRHAIAARAQRVEHPGDLRIGRHRAHVIPQMLKGRLGRDHINRARLEGARKVARPGLGKGAEGRLGTVNASVAHQPLRFGQRARGVEPGLPDLLAAGVNDPVIDQHLVNQLGEVALFELQQGAVAVKGDGAHRIGGALGAHNRRSRLGGSLALAHWGLTSRGAPASARPLWRDR